MHHPSREENCFICEEPDERPVYRVCVCDRWVHEACFKEVIARVPSHSTHCPVCLHSYATTVGCDPQTVMRTCFVLAFTCMWLGVVYETLVETGRTPASCTLFAASVLWAVYNVSETLSRAIVREVKAAPLQTATAWSSRAE